MKVKIQQNICTYTHTYTHIYAQLLEFYIISRVYARTTNVLRFLDSSRNRTKISLFPDNEILKSVIDDNNFVSFIKKIIIEKKMTSQCSVVIEAKSNFRK